MNTPAVTKVRSSTFQQAERTLHWYTDEIHPYAYLDGYVIRVADSSAWSVRGGSQAFTQKVTPDHRPVGKVLNWGSLDEALTMLGWEPV